MSSVNSECLSISPTFLANISSNATFCPPLFDRTCWPTTLANQWTTIPCSSLAIQGVDPSKYVSRFCLPSGKWANVSYQPCIYPDVWNLMMKFYITRSPQQRKIYTDVLQAVRIVELVGLSVSFISVLLSLIIFFSLKSLYCSRTKIHINLLLAILIQIIARVVDYGIQMKHSPSATISSNESHIRQSDLPPSVVLVCPFIVIVLQFSITAMFMWMLCEGIHLNNVLTVSVFKNNFKTIYFYILGWVVPFCLTLSWSTIMFVKERARRCWSNYNYLGYYWIIDGPRYAVMIINFIFLLNIIRVLVVKIKEGSEKQVRDHGHRRGSTNRKSVKKAVKAAIFLLPLLGFTHMLETFITPDDQSIILFTLYCSVTYFLVTFEGFFCSLLYCFLNTEVRETLARRFRQSQYWSRWKLCLGNKQDRYGGRRNVSGDRTRMESLIPHTDSTLKKSPIELDECRLTTPGTDETPRQLHEEPF